MALSAAAQVMANLKPNSELHQAVLLLRDISTGWSGAVAWRRAQVLRLWQPLLDAPHPCL